MGEQAAQPLRLAALAATLGLVGGCALVPKEKLDQCHQLSVGLQSEVAQLKDESLRLKTQNRDYALRAVQDERRIRTLDETNQRLERSVLAYQRERDEINAAFNRFRQEIVASVDRLPTAMLDRLDDFARSHPGCAFDRDAALTTFAAEGLFQPGTDQWTTGGEATLRQYAGLLAEPAGAGLDVRVAARAGASDPAIRRTSLNAAAAAAAPDELARARAVKVRDLLASLAPPDGPRIEAITPAEATPGAPPASPRIEIRLEPRSPAAFPPAPSATVPEPSASPPTMPGPAASAQRTP